jgi:hypothetical protein
MTQWKLLVSGLFNLTIVLHFIFTSQYKHNMYTLSINIKFIYALCENGQKISSKDKCVPVSKVLTNNLFLLILHTYWFKTFAMYTFAFSYSENV